MTTARRPIDSMSRQSSAVIATHTEAASRLCCTRCHRRPDELQVVREADRAAGDRQRRDEDGLEDEEEAHQPAEAERLERLAQVEIAAAAARQRGAELRVDEAVGERQHRARDPRVEDVRPVHRLDHERDGEERPDADHADDVGGGGLQQAHAAVEVGAPTSGIRDQGSGSGSERAEPIAAKLQGVDERAAAARSGTRGFSASASTSALARAGAHGGNRRALERLHPHDEVAHLRRAARRRAWRLGPFAFTTHGTSITSSASRSGMLPRFRTLSGNHRVRVPHDGLNGVERDLVVAGKVGPRRGSGRTGLAAGFELHVAGAALGEVALVARHRIRLALGEVGEQLAREAARSRAPRVSPAARRLATARSGDS